MSNNQTKITFNEAQKRIMAMNLIDNYLWNSANEDKEDSKKIANIILSNVLDKKVQILDVTVQKGYSAADTIYHAIRMDAKIDTFPKDDELLSTLYNIEMENRESDRHELPRRLRFYTAVPDSKNLPSGSDYDMLPNYISIIILSYDPFLLGSMYYEAKMHLSTHPDYNYDDGRKVIFLYADGTPNFINDAYGKRIQELLKYIVHGDKSASNDDVETLDNIVSKVKSQSEVTVKYMRQIDYERGLIRDTRREDAIKQILISRKHHIPDSEIKQDIVESYSYDDSQIESLLKEASKRSTSKNV